VYLDELAATLRANARMTVQLEAYVAASDPTASLALTRRRALAVRDQLVKRRVAPDRIHAYGCGESRPIAPNNVPWGRKKNDRVELHLLDPVPSSGVHSTQGCVPAD
jgi:outer membrane protein OmpA-like peptidoglycan-associated protein